MSKGRPSPNRVDLTGLRFGRLVAQSYCDTAPPHSIARWNCACDCGNTTIVKRDMLRNGKIKSCGCLLAEHRMKSRVKLTPGQLYNRLIPEYPTGSRSGAIVWKCTCTCGNIAIVRASYIVNGHTKSCGCLRREAQRENIRGYRERRKEIYDGLLALEEITEILNIRTAQAADSAGT